MKRITRAVGWLALALVLVGPSVHAEDTRTEDEKKADQYLADGMRKIGELRDERNPKERRKLAEEAADLFMQACQTDENCDERFFPNLRRRPEGDNKDLRAMLHSLFAKGFCAIESWDKSLKNIDLAIDLHTRMTPQYRRLKGEILRRKRQAEGDRDKTSADDYSRLDVPEPALCSAAP